MQSEVYKKLEDADFCWMESSTDSRKVASIISMQEQMVETAVWKISRGMPQISEKCRLCREKAETVYHWLSGCKKIAGNEYVVRHDNALKILCVEWCKLEGLLSQSTVWYKEKWSRGHTLENDERKFSWDFEYGMSATTTQRRPDATLEYKDRKLIYLLDMACPHDDNLKEKYSAKIAKYQQLAYELRERRPGYHVEVVPMVVGCMGSGARLLTQHISKVISEEETIRWITREMIKIVVWHSESIVRKVLSGVIQPDFENELIL